MDGIERVKVPHGRLQPSAALHDDNCAIRCKHPDMEAFAMRPVGYSLTDRRRCNDPGDRSDVLAASHEMMIYQHVRMTWTTMTVVKRSPAKGLLFCLDQVFGVVGALGTGSTTSASTGNRAVHGEFLGWQRNNSTRPTQTESLDSMIAAAGRTGASS